MSDCGPMCPCMCLHAYMYLCLKLPACRQFNIERYNIRSRKNGIWSTQLSDWPLSPSFVASSYWIKRAMEIGSDLGAENHLRLKESGLSTTTKESESLLRKVGKKRLSMRHHLFLVCAPAIFAVPTLGAGRDAFVGRLLLGVAFAFEQVAFLVLGARP